MRSVAPRGKGHPGGDRRTLVRVILYWLRTRPEFDPEPGIRRATVGTLLDVLASWGTGPDGGLEPEGIHAMAVDAFFSPFSNSIENAIRATFTGGAGTKVAGGAEVTVLVDLTTLTLALTGGAVLKFKRKYLDRATVLLEKIVRDISHGYEANGADVRELNGLSTQIRNARLPEDRRQPPT